MTPKISDSMNDLTWPFPPLKLSLRNENDAYGNMHHNDVYKRAQMTKLSIFVVFVIEKIGKAKRIV